MSRFEYRAFKTERVVELIVAQTALPDAMPGAYIASDAGTDAIRAALEEGFRWVRTEEGYAIFEREVPGGG